MQTPYTDKNSAYSFAKLRNSNTTQASKNFIFQDFNHGILMDIFPLDKWDSSDKIAFDTIKYLALENSTYMRKENPILSEYDRRRVKIWSGIDSLTIFEIIQKIAKKYSNVETDCVAIAVCSLLKYENNYDIMLLSDSPVNKNSKKLDFFNEFVINNIQEKNDSNIPNDNNNIFKESDLFKNNIWNSDKKGQT